MANYFEILCGIAAICLALYYYLTSNYDFWKSRGVAGPQPVPVFGTIKAVMTGKQSMGDYLKTIYDEYKNEPVVGIFARKTPVLVVNDPDVIKDVLIRDFSKFADRGMPVHEKTEPLSQHIFSLEPARWRPLRSKLSPVFTSGKLKEMFTLIVECSEQLEHYLDTLVEKGEPIECRELTAKYTTDVIGSCAFGIEMNSLSDEESEFRRMGKQVFTVNFLRLIRLRLRQSFPMLYGLLGYILPETEVTRFFRTLVKDTMDYRKKNNIVRPDFVNLLLELEKNRDKLGTVKLTDNILASQAFVFFAAGFETSATTMTNALYELALNPEVQKKLRAEIKQEYLQNNGDLKYDNIKEMKYLDAVFREALRKYPPATFLLRQSTSDYTFEGTKITIPKDLKVWIPLYAIHHDPAIYPNPETFDPERFTEEAMAARHPMHYLPFGDGPRNCIGARFAVYQTKIGLIKILRNHRVEVCEKTQIPYIIDPNAFLLCPKGGIYLKIVKENS